MSLVSDDGGGSGATRFFKLPDAVCGEHFRFETTLELAELRCDATVLIVDVDTVDEGVTQMGIAALGNSELCGPLAPLLGLEPDRKLSDVEERERICTGDPPPTKLGGRD